MNRILSTAQIEHGWPILAELTQLEALIAAFFEVRDGLAAPAMAATGAPMSPEGMSKAIAASPDMLRLLLPLLRAVKQLGEARVLRKISAVVRATDDQLLEAEGSPEKWKELLAEAARRPYLETVMDLIGFFSRLGLSQLASPESLLGETEEGTSEESDDLPEDSLSGVS